MSTLTLTCVTCDEDAGDVGDYGALGTPDLGTKVRKGTRAEDLPFGHLYEALREIGLRPRDLEEREAFLRSHAGHDLVQWSDLASPEHLPPALVAVLEKRDHIRPPKRVPAKRGAIVAGRKASEWIFGAFGVRCTRCHASCVSREQDRLRRLDGPLRLTRQAADMLLERWGKRLSAPEWHYRLRPLVDPLSEFMPKLLAFFTKHRTHEMESFFRPRGE